ncbi:hypothetical protein KCU89_g102, partial [Aureobasidium melanogenum]
MDTKSERWSGSTLPAHVSGNTEDESERRIVANLSYRPPAIQIEADRRKWNSCRTWEDAMRLNAQFFAGRLEVGIDSSFDPMDMENETLHMLLNHIYVVRHHPRRLGKGYTHDGKAFITRQMGSCCFMLPYDHELIVPLMVALLGSRRLSTTVVYRGDEDLSEGPLCNFDCNTVQEISCGKSRRGFTICAPSTVPLSAMYPRGTKCLKQSKGPFFPGLSCSASIHYVLLSLGTPLPFHLELLLTTARRYQATFFFANELTQDRACNNCVHITVDPFFIPSRFVKLIFLDMITCVDLGFCNAWRLRHCDVVLTASSQRTKPNLVRPEVRACQTQLVERSVYRVWIHSARREDVGAGL